MIGHQAQLTLMQYNKMTGTLIVLKVIGIMENKFRIVVSGKCRITTPWKHLMQIDVRHRFGRNGSCAGNGGSRNLNTQFREASY